MTIFDVSVPISNRTPVYPGDPAPRIHATQAIARGDAANVTELHLGAHTATHVDAPAHFIEGAGRVESLPLNVLIGEARVIELPPDVRAITAAHAGADALLGATRVLFKTRNSEFWHTDPHRFRDDFTYIAPDAAHALADAGVCLVGIDYLSIEQMHTENFPTHRILLSRGIIIIEGLDLSLVAAGCYELLCLPLKLAEATGDGAPARVLLRTPSGQGAAP